jgi:N-methylhydantoinase B/oxoprolinase/acetone carboxylase alpha subunit
MTEQATAVQLAIFNARMESVTRRMANTLLRTGRSGVINTARDFSCSLVTARGELLSVSEGFPIHMLRGAELMARCMASFHPNLKRGPVDCAVEVGFACDGVVNPAQGVRGGGPGALAEAYLRRASGERESLPGSSHLTVAEGESLVSLTAGGGGYGTPLERAPERVAHDVVEGWISPERARKV